jgi:hypothetical protein
MYISITGLKSKNFLSKIKFWILAALAFRAAQKAEGNLFCEVKSANGYQHTITAWKNRNFMMKYLMCKPHAKAMKNFRSIATGSTYGYESDQIPSWNEALELWQKNYKEY